MQESREYISLLAKVNVTANCVRIVAPKLFLASATAFYSFLDYFRLAPDSASISAFIQQRDKILPEAFITLFHLFTRKACPQKLYKGLRLLAADGSDIQISTNPNDANSYFPGSSGQKPYNLLHLNALYDLNTR